MINNLTWDTLIKILKSFIGGRPSGGGGVIFSKRMMKWTVH